MSNKGHLQMLSAAIEQSTEGIAVSDLEGKLLFLNDAFAALHGYSASELIGKHLSVFHTTEQMAAVEAANQEIRRTGKFSGEVWHVRRDGEVFLGRMHNAVFSDATGKAIGMIGTLRDITEEKEAELALLRVTHDLEERVKELKCLYGISTLVERPETTLEHILQGIVDLIPPSWQYPESTCARIVLKGKIFTSHGFKESARKLSREIVAQGSPIGVLEVCFQGNLGSNEDPFLEEEKALLDLINERVGEVFATKKAEELLKESQSRFRDLYENAPNAYFSVGVDGLIHACNKRVTELLGYPKKDLIGQPVLSLYADSSSGKEKAIEVFRRFQAGVPIIDEELQMQKIDGEPVWVSLTVNAVKDAQGRVLESRSMVMDITERIKAEEALKRRTRQLDALRQIGLELTAELDLDSLLHSIVRHAIDLLAGSAGQLHLYQPEPEGLKRILAAGPDTELNLENEDPGQGIADQVWQWKKPLVAELPRDDLSKPEAVTGQAHIASVAAPIRWGEEFLGVLSVLSQNVESFSYADARLLEQLATQAAIAIQNARLFGRVQEGHERLRLLTQQVVSAQEEERHRVSRELHDEAGQALTALRLNLGLIRANPPLDGDGHLDILLLRRQLDEAMALCDATMTQIRSLAHNLRPAAIDDLGLSLTLESFCSDFAERTQLSIDYYGSEPPHEPGAAGITLYRCLQEALTNVARHSGADHAWVELNHDIHCISLSIEDDGRGFDPNTTLAGSDPIKGIGILGMRERIESMGGSFEIESQQARGTRLVISVPANTGA